MLICAAEHVVPHRTSGTIAVAIGIIFAAMLLAYIAQRLNKK